VDVPVIGTCVDPVIARSSGRNGSNLMQMPCQASSSAVSVPEAESI
jgi:hypothetical protein